MSELLTRTSVRNSRPGERARPPADGPAAGHPVWVRGAFAALSTVALGVATLVVVVLVVWATDSRSGASATEAMRTALQLWLVAHRVPMHVSGGSVAIAPLGLTLVLAALVAHSAAVVARVHAVDGPRGVAVTALAVGVPYGVLCTFVAAAANSRPVRPDPVAALTAGTALGCLAAAWGAARAAGVVREVWDLVPPRIRHPIGAGATALVIVAAAGVVVVAGSVAVHLSAAKELAGPLGGGVVGTLALVAIDLALLPNAAACVVGYLAGPGFAVGAGTSVTLGHVTLRTVPALPLLGALPHGAAPLPVTLLGAGILVVAGGCAGRRVSRVAKGARETLLLTGGAGAAAGLLAAGFLALAGGPAGPGAMSAVGASPWQTGLAIAGEIGFVAVVAAALRRLRRAR